MTGWSVSVSSVGQSVSSKSVSYEDGTFLCLPCRIRGLIIWLINFEASTVQGRVHGGSLDDFVDLYFRIMVFQPDIRLCVT